MLKSLFKLFTTKRKTRSHIIRIQGAHYNLKEIYDRLNAQYFEGKLLLAITWVSPKKTKYRRRILLGSFHPHLKLIKVNRLLDTAETPPYFIDFIVYHEMLHFVLPPIFQKNRSRQIHHRAFKEQEKKFQQYALAKAYREKSKGTWFVD